MRYESRALGMAWERDERLFRKKSRKGGSYRCPILGSRIGE
jgi:hypothetical protein